MSAKRALVVGGYGFLGSTISEAFKQAGWEVIRGSRSRSCEEDAVRVDLSDPETVSQAARDVDVVVNTVPDPELTAESVILETGGLILNVATIDQRPVRAFRDRASLGHQRGTVVVNAGLAPGLTNLIVADLLRQHPLSNGVEIVMGLPTKGMSGKSGVRFVHENLVTTRRGGVRIRHHRTKPIPLPEPIGPRSCFGFGELQGGWLLGSAGVRAVYTYGYLDAKPLHSAITALNALRLLPHLPLTPLMFGHNTIPDTATLEPVAHWLAVLDRDGTRIAARTVRCAGDYVSTGAVTVVTAEALLHANTATPAGCFVVDELLTLADLEDELQRQGITVTDESDVKAKPLHAPHS